MDYLQPLVVVMGQLCIIDLPDSLYSFHWKEEKVWAKQGAGSQSC